MHALQEQIRRITSEKRTLEKLIAVTRDEAALRMRDAAAAEQRLSSAVAAAEDTIAG